MSCGGTPPWILRDDRHRAERRRRCRCGPDTARRPSTRPPPTNAPRKKYRKSRWRQACAEKELRRAGRGRVVAEDHREGAQAARFPRSMSMDPPAVHRARRRADLRRPVPQLKRRRDRQARQSRRCCARRQRTGHRRAACARRNRGSTPASDRRRSRWARWRTRPRNRSARGRSCAGRSSGRSENAPPGRAKAERSAGRRARAAAPRGATGRRACSRFMIADGDLHRQAGQSAPLRSWRAGRSGGPARASAARCRRARPPDRRRWRSRTAPRLARPSSCRRPAMTSPSLRVNPQRGSLRARRSRRCALVWRDHGRARRPCQ